MTPSDIFTQAEILNKFGCKLGTYNLWSARGKIPQPSMRIGNSPIWFRTDLEAWEAAKEKAPGFPQGL